MFIINLRRYVAASRAPSIEVFSHALCITALERVCLEQVVCPVLSRCGELKQKIIKNRGPIPGSIFYEYLLSYWMQASAAIKQVSYH